jgi:hypothetical protein
VGERRRSGGNASEVGFSLAVLRFLNQVELGFFSPESFDLGDFSASGMEGVGGGTDVSGVIPALVSTEGFWDDALLEDREGLRLKSPVFALDFPSAGEATRGESTKDGTASDAAGEDVSILRLTNSFFCSDGNGADWISSGSCTSM